MGRRCCCEGCVYFNDSFDRPDSTDIGSDWRECSGNWSIDNQRLKEAGTVDSIAHCNTPNPYPNAYFLVYATTVGEVSGAKYRVYVCRADGECDKTVYVELEIGGNPATGSVLRICDKFDNVIEEATITSLTGTSRTIIVCLDPNGIIAIVSNAVFSHIWASGTACGNAKWFGLGNGSTYPIYFSDVEALTHKINHADCPECVCGCWDGQDMTWPPKTLTATFSATGGCMEMDGLTVDLEYDRISDDWLGQGVIDCATFDLVLTCNTYPGYCTDWILANTGQCRASDPDLGVKTANSGCTCSPIVMVFGPFEVKNSDLECGCCGFLDPGTYTITVTA